MTATLYNGTPTITVTDNRGLAVRRLQYNRAKKEATVDELITAMTYSVAGFALNQTDPRLGRLQTNTQPANFRYRPDLAGRALRTDSVDAGVHWSVFDIEGRPIWQQDAGSTVTHTEYDTLGRLTRVSEQRVGKGQLILLKKLSYGDSELDRRASAQAANLCGVVSQQLDTAGQLTTPAMTLTGQPHVQIRRLLKMTQGDPDWDAKPQPVLEQTTYETAWTYNALGAPLTQTDAKGNVQQIYYDVAGQLAAASLKQANGAPPQVLLKSIYYSAHGQIESETAGNDVTTAYTYCPKTLRLKKSLAQNAQDKILQQLEYQYDPVGNILSIEDKADVSAFFSNEEIKPKSTYAYDALYQLVRATGREQANANPGCRLPEWMGPPPSNARVNYTREYEYDRGGNLTKIQCTRGALRFTQKMKVIEGSNRLGALLFPSDANNPPGVNVQAGDTVDHFKYDANGNPGVLGIKELKSLQWNGRNQLNHVVLLSHDNGDSDEEHYQYDGNGQRIRKITSTLVTGDDQSKLKHKDEVIYLPGLELRRSYEVKIEGNKMNETLIKELHIMAFNEVGRARVRVLHWQKPKLRDGDPIKDQFRYSLNNHLGSSMMELDQDAKLLTYEEYYPYGGTAVWAAKNETEAKYKYVRYSGKERDATGLYHYGFRYYAPWLGRWLNPDPAGTVDGLNLFQMVGNNPITFIDHAGLAKIKPQANKNEEKKNNSGRSYDYFTQIRGKEKEFRKMINEGKIMRKGKSSFISPARSTKDIKRIGIENENVTIRYRALRLDEINRIQSGIFAKNEKSEISRHAHIANGSKPGRGSRYISASRDLGVVSAYSLKNSSGYNKTGYVAKFRQPIESEIFDTSFETHGAEIKWLAHNYARASQEVLTQDLVPCDDILTIYRVTKIEENEFNAESEKDGKFIRAKASNNDQEIPMRLDDVTNKIMERQEINLINEKEGDIFAEKLSLSDDIRQYPIFHISSNRAVM